VLAKALEEVALEVAALGVDPVAVEVALIDRLGLVIESVNVEVQVFWNGIEEFMNRYLVLQRRKRHCWMLAIILVAFTSLKEIERAFDQSNATTTSQQRHVAKVNVKSQMNWQTNWLFAEPLALARGEPYHSLKGPTRKERARLGCADIDWPRMDKIVDDIVAKKYLETGMRMSASSEKKRYHRLADSSVGRCGPGWDLMQEMGTVFTQECCTHDVVIDQLIAKFRIPLEEAHELAINQLEPAIKSYLKAVGSVFGGEAGGDGGNSGNSDDSGNGGDNLS
jgi:hypothetical protein